MIGIKCLRLTPVKPASLNLIFRHPVMLARAFIISLLFVVSHALWASSFKRRRIIAMRDQATLPFPVDAIDFLFQTPDDCNPTKRNDWAFFDDWS